MTDEPGGNSKGMLASYVERIEALEAEKKGLADDIKDIYTEVRAAGLSAKHVRAIIKERRQDPAERRAFEETLDQYRAALGMLADSPLGAAAMKKRAEA